MSGPPKRKPTSTESNIPTFPDPEAHTDLITMRKEIKGALLNIQKTLPKGDDRHRLVTFANVLHPGSHFDPGRLPYDSQTGRTKTKRCESCLLAMVSKLVQDYWWLVLEEREPSKEPRATVEGVRAQLDALEKIVKKGVSRCQIIGDENKGYELAC